MNAPIVKEAEAFVSELLTEQLTADYRYHDLLHTLSVLKASQLLADKLEINEEEKEILALAALFHDTGFVEIYEGHETVSQKIAQTFLEDRKYPKKKLNKVLACIMATKVDYPPENLLQRIIKDADLNNLGGLSFNEKAKNLRYEWENILKQDISNSEWLDINIDFWGNHNYYTEAGERLFGEAKSENLKKLRKKVDKKKKQKKAKSIEDVGLLNASKSAQMMFKTTLRNHIDLTSIADNKANIMLSINALIITVTMPLLASNVKGNMYLLIPTSILLLTCTLSIIFATLATTPVPTSGTTDLSKIGSGNTNLFFYGNFWRMGLGEFKGAIKEVAGNDKELDDSVMNDLYFLGIALGKKFQRLRICYSIFMYGITLTVLAFALSFFWEHASTAH